MRLRRLLAFLISVALFGALLGQPMAAHAMGDSAMAAMNQGYCDHEGKPAPLKGTSVTCMSSLGCLVVNGFLPPETFLTLSFEEVSLLRGWTDKAAVSWAIAPE